MKEKGFTLVEMAACAVITLATAAVVAPAVTAGREKEKQGICASHLRQIARAVRAYAADHDGALPVFHQYNVGTPHRGVEVALTPYVREPRAFLCPADVGSPFQRKERPLARSYFEAYGTSYRFEPDTFTVIGGVSSFNGGSKLLPGYVFEETKLVRLSDFTRPERTRIARDEMFPSDRFPILTYRCGGPDFYQLWHATGGNVALADGGVAFVNTPKDYDAHRTKP